MKINFEELFEGEGNKFKMSNVSKLSGFPTNQSLSNSFRIEPKENKIIHSAYDKEKNSIMNTIQRNKT
jgi:hypothetical protein